LLVEAYQNREVLEEKIAEGRRNRKEAGNKYGALHSRLPAYACRLIFLKDFNVTSLQTVVWASTHASLSFRIVFHPRGLPSSIYFSLSVP
jgi:Mitotic checkpoint regulator, MAD2B-interacting